MVAGVGDVAPKLVGRLFNKQASGDTASRVAGGIDKGELDALNRGMLPIINQTLLKIFLNTKQTANPFVKDGIERFERFLQKKKAETAISPKDDEPEEE